MKILFPKLEHTCCGCSVAGLTCTVLYTILVLTMWNLLMVLFWERYCDITEEEDQCYLRRIGNIFIDVICIFLEMLSLCGYHTRRSSFFIPFLILYGIVFIIMFLLSVIGVFCHTSVLCYPEKNQNFAIFFVIILLSTGILYYVFLVLCSHVRNLKYKFKRIQESDQNDNELQKL